MKILIAQDDPVLRRLLQAAVLRWGYQAIVAHDGIQAWEVLQSSYAPSFSIIERAMPGLDALEICRRLRASVSSRPHYVIILSAGNKEEDIVAALQSGADDCLAKPLDLDDLKARVRRGERIVELQTLLANPKQDMGTALLRLKELHELLPTCQRRIGRNQDFWKQVKGNLASHLKSGVNCGACPHCYAEDLMAAPAQCRPIDSPGDDKLAAAGDRKSPLAESGY